MKRKYALTALILAVALCICGCGADGRSSMTYQTVVSEWYESSSEVGSEESEPLDTSLSSDNSSFETSLKGQAASTISSADSSTLLSEADLLKTDTVDKLLENMSLKQKAAQLFIVRPEQLLGGSAVTECKVSSLAYDVGGVVLFAKNIVNPAQCTGLISSLQAASEHPLFVAVDEEGGRVARIANNPLMETTVFPDMGRLATPSDAYNAGKTIGSEIAEYGFNLDFAPVADVNSNPDNPIIGSRAFSGSQHSVSDFVKSAVRGFKDGGVLCTLKHFPGHGDTRTDSHLQETKVDKTLFELRETEFVPFKAGIDEGAEFVMVGHLSLPKVTGNSVPATLSSKIIDILRDELGFGGIIITDSMEMKAITEKYTADVAAVEAIKAGIDIILIPEDLDLAIDGIINAVKSGDISEERINKSVSKILELKLEKGIIK